MQQAVYYHSAVALDTNTALVCGGMYTTAQSQCFSYAAEADVWSPAAQMNTARYGHGMAVYKGAFVLPTYSLLPCLFVTDRVFVYGGGGGRVEMLSIDNQTWSFLPKHMHAATSFFASVPLP
jgi:hypothetical protein